jgi:uncharacterized membrane protein YccC
MNRADETAAKMETAERQSVGAAAGFDDMLAKKLENFPGASHQSRTAEDLHTLLLRISHRLDYEHAERKTIDYRLRAIESQTRATGRQTKRRASRAFVRYLVAICVGVAGTLAWQSYGEEAKQTIATKAPELGWSPEVRQMIASWTKPLAGPENTAARPPVQETQQAAPVAQTAPEAVAPTPAAPSFDPEQAKQMAQSIDELRQTVGRLAATQEQIASHLAATQEQIGREMTRLQAADQEILAKIPAPRPLSPPAAATRKPPSVPPQRAPTTSLTPHP